MTPAQLIANGWVRGLDVSDNQSKRIDWARLYTDGYRFVWVKLTEGETFSSKTGRQKALDAQSEGFRVGGYHYARPDNGNDPEREARNFAAELYAAGESVVSGLPPVLDYEERIKTGRGSAKDWAAAFSAHLASIIGEAPWYYSGLRTYLRHAPEGAKLWVAAYLDVLPFADRYACWQHTGSGQVKGYAGHLDLNLMNPETWKEITK